MAISSKMSKYLIKILKEKGWEAYDKAAKSMRGMIKKGLEGPSGPRQYDTIDPELVNNKIVMRALQRRVTDPNVSRDRKRDAMRKLAQLNVKSFKVKNPNPNVRENVQVRINHQLEAMGYNPNAKVSSKFGIGENLTNDDVYRMWKRGDISRKEHLMFTKFDPAQLQHVKHPFGPKFSNWDRLPPSEVLKGPYSGAAKSPKTRRQLIEEKIERIRNNPELSRNFLSNLQRNVDENIKKYGK